MTTITIDEIQSDLLGYLRRVQAGETLLIMQADKPVAEIKPVIETTDQVIKELRPFALCRGEFTVPVSKLPLPQPPETYLPEQRRRHLIVSLGVDEESVSRLAGLPSLHRDPFDRLLVCQAIQHDLTLVTVDPIVKSYPATVL